MRGPVKSLTIPCLAASLLAIPATASAWIQTTTCDPTGGLYACQPGESPLPVQWEDRTMRYYINNQGSEEFPAVNGETPQEVVDVIKESFRAWDFVDCSYFTIVYEGQTPDDFVGYNPDITNRNIVLFQQQWPHAQGAYALTSVTYSPRTGLIADADIEFNDTFWTFNIAQTPGPEDIDLLNTSTHEVGHFLGLDHSDVLDSTMFENAEPGEFKKRDLSQDDIDGICSIYTPLPAPEPVEDGGCCTQVPRRSPAPWGAALLLGLLGLTRRRTS
jgi:hypothetical protein